MAIGDKIVKRYIVKRDLKEIFPKEFTGRELIGKFFDYVMNNFFEKSYERYINGYIGRRTELMEEGNFYLKEPNYERQLYQLTPMLIDTKNDSSEIKDIVDYSNFINTLKLQNALTNDHNRLLSNKHWSYCPPINPDMLLNYNFYYWVEEGIKPIIIEREINEDGETSTIVNTNAVLNIIGKEKYTYRYFDDNGDIKTIPFYNGMRVIFKNDDNLEYNNKPFIVEGVNDSIILIDDSEIFNPTNETEPEYFVMDRGCIDGNPWSLRNRWFHIDVIKKANLYNETEEDNNEYIQAKRPIICFNRDLELYNFGNYDRGWVDVITTTQKTDVQGAVIDPLVGKLKLDDRMLDTGAKIIFTNEPIEENNNLMYELFLVDDSNGNKIATLYLVTNGRKDDGKPTEGECVKVRNSQNMCWYYNGESWVLSQQKTKLCQSPLFNLYDINEDSLSNKEIYPGSTFMGNTVFNYKNVDNAQIGLDEYLKRKITVDGYGNYIFDNTISSSKYTYDDISSNSQIKEIEGMKFCKINGKEKEFVNDWHLSNDILTQYVVTELTVSDKRNLYTYVDEKNLPVEYEVFDIAYEPFKNDYKENIFVYLNGEMLEKGDDFGLGTFVVKGKKLFISLKSGLKVNDVIYIKILVDKVDELAYGYVFDLPLMLSSNGLNESITEIKYNEMFDQLESILENQYGFEGLINGANNFNETKKDLSLGTKIVQHSTPIVKTMLLNSKEYTNVRNVMTYTENEYTKFKNKFLTILDKMVEDGEYKQYDRDWNETNPYLMVVKILNRLNVGKEGLRPFYNNGVAEGLINDDEDDELYLKEPYIPSTPAYLGLDNCYKPEILQPNMDLKKTTLLCHDGSYESLAGDYRDNTRLVLEQEIYNSINSDFKDGLPTIIKQKYIPGKFRKTDYSYEDYLKLYVPFFEKWCIENGLNYEINDTFDENNPFTWNWSSCVDKDGFKLPGSYRGIYQYYYDTDKPHTNPWEMLGFGSKPEWWETHYGKAPYTSENIPMWKDIEEGHIVDGNSKGYYEEFKRDGLVENYLPVDSEGNLLNPYEIGIATSTPSIYYASRTWKIGDLGHIENVWRHTSEYRYSLQTLLYLMKPLEWVEKSWNTLSQETLFKGTKYEQIINRNSGNRDKETDIEIHNELINGKYVRNIGSQQWFSDFLVGESINITDYIGDDLRNMDLRLGYRCAGFYDKDSMRVISDNYGVIPENNYHLKLSEKKLPEVFSYSAILITKYDDSWMIDGFDYEQPYFNVFEPYKDGKKTPVEINGRNFTYYNQYTNNIKQIKYKTVFYSAQELYNVICGYGKYLESKGFVFNLVDQNGEQIDFRSEGRKFLLWYDNSSIENGMILQLNPMKSEVNLKHTGFVDCVGQFFNGFWSVLNPLPTPIYNNELRVYRHNGYVTVNPKNDLTIATIKFTLSEKENILLFDNETIYGDTLYNSLKGTKTERLRILGIKSNGWNGTYYAPGYIINASETIEPDYDKLADDFNYVYDSDSIKSFSKMGDEAKKTIGYHETNYMENLLIDNRNMFDFYKGMLKEKGTRLAFNKLNRSTHIMSEGSSELNLDEHWVFNVGQFGYTKEKSTIELLVDANKINHDPQIITFSSDPDYKSDDDSNIYFEWNNDKWLKRNENQDENTFVYNDNYKKLPTGGFAQIDDCDYILDTKESLNENIENLYNGDKVWVVKDNEYTWNMYKKIDNELTPLKSLKVNNIKSLLAYNTLNLDKDDLIYVEKDTLDNWVTRLSEDESANVLNLYINDSNNMIKNQNYITKTVGWSVFAYTGIVPYSYVISMPNGIIGVENNVIEYIMRVKKDLLLNMPNGKDEEGNNLYTSHKVSNDIIITNYQDDSYDNTGTFSKNYGRFTDFKATCAPSIDNSTYVFTFSIHFETGIQLVVLDKDAIGDDIVVETKLFTNDINHNLNGGVYKKGAWQHTIASDEGDYMLWKSSKGGTVRSLNYISADNMNWYRFDNKITVHAKLFTYAISDDGKTLTVYKNGLTFKVFTISDKTIDSRDYNYVIIDDKDNIFKIDNFDSNDTEPNRTLLINDFWYNPLTNLLSRYNGYFWENSDLTIHAWDNHNKSYYTIDEIPEFNSDMYYYNNNKIEKYNLTTGYYIPKKFAWKYNDEIFYTDSDAPKAGDKVYLIDRISECDIVSSYFDGSDYFYCDTKKYIRDEEHDYNATLTSVTNIEFIRNEDNDIRFNHYSKIADVNIKSGKLVDISVPNPFELKRIEQKPINLDLVNNVKLVNDDNDLTLANLNMFDPLHCKLPEKYIKEIDYISSYDPVNYDDPNRWYENKIGRLWWDTSKVRYLDYYQGDLKYRRDNWGKQLPGSEISIMEWTRSTILPDDAEKYIVQEVYNNQTNKIDTYYYFWVMNPSTIPEQDFRTTSAYDISRNINSPQDEGMLWFSPINLVNRVYDDSSFIIGNFDNVSGSNDFVVQINFKNRNDVDDHNEWQMIIEDSNDNIPDKLWDKMKYSLIGEMKIIEDGEEKILSIPDESLPNREKYGIQIRPRQTMFKDIIRARRNFVDAVNDVLSSRDIRSSSTDNFDVFNIKDESYKEYDISYEFESHEEMMMNKDKSLIGTYVLVKSDEYYENIWTLWYMRAINNYELTTYQKYDMGRYTYYIDAFVSNLYTKDTYNKRVYNTPNNEALTKLVNNGIPDGYIVRVDDPVTKDWIYLLQYNSSTNTFYIIGLRNGYVQISDNLYTYMEDINDNEFIDGVTYHDYVNEEVKVIIEIICDYFYNN